jgi:hypothetical protein
VSEMLQSRVSAWNSDRCITRMGSSPVCVCFCVWVLLCVGVERSGSKLLNYVQEILGCSMHPTSIKPTGPPLLNQNVLILTTFND